MSEPSVCPSHDEYGCPPSVAVPTIRWILPAAVGAIAFFDFPGEEIGIPDKDRPKPCPVWQWECGCWRVVKAADYPTAERDLAERIANDLMTNGDGERAQRIVLMADERRGPDGRLIGRDLGGRSAVALVDRIERTLAELGGEKA